MYLNKFATMIVTMTMMVLVFNPTTALATKVYKTVDENGVVSFSDTPPEGESEVLKISAPAPQSPEDYIENIEAMRETTDRMAQDRREREKHRAELKELAAKNNAQKNPAQQYYDDYYYPVYSGRYRHQGKPPYHPGYRPTPEHPIAHPPLLPVAGPFQPRNSQLMRPMLPRR